MTIYCVFEHQLSDGLHVRIAHACEFSTEVRKALKRTCPEFVGSALTFPDAQKKYGKQHRIYSSWRHLWATAAVMRILIVNRRMQDAVPH
jgi:hypothetical protein